MRKLTALIEARDLKGLETFDVGHRAEWKGVIASTMRQAYDYAKTGAADELRRPAPPTKRETTLFINQHAQAVTDKQYADLLFQIRTVVLSDLRRNTLSETQLSLGDVLAAITALFGEFFDTKLALTGSVITYQSLNRGRDDVFEDARDDIYAYQYSALLRNSCPTCIDLDGSVVDYGTYRSTRWKPPIHFSCMCLWVAILKREVNPPPITGLPDAPGGDSQPQL